MGNTRSQGKLTFLNWLLALALSPGMLFPAGYLVVYLATNIHLNSSFKENMSQEFLAATENRVSISIGTMRAGLDFRSVTLQKLELKPAENVSRPSDNVAIPALRIEQLNLCNLLFDRTCREQSVKTITRQILRNNRTGVIAHHH